MKEPWAKKVKKCGKVCFSAEKCLILHRFLGIQKASY